MENKMSLMTYTRFIRELERAVKANKISIDIANKTMHRVAINNDLPPIYLW
ncbi:MAG: hypothetical protein R3Y09_12195 [Clostridia bacterium]